MRSAAVGLGAALLVAVLPPSARSATPTSDLGAPYELEVAVAGGNAVGRITDPGLDCPAGEGAYRHYGIEAPLAAGLFSSLSGTLRGTLDVHDGPFLAASGSHVTLDNERGTLRFTLTGGDCENPSLVSTGPDGVAGSGDLVQPVGTGAYREAAIAGGTYSLTAEVAPGADNPWSLTLSGSVQVLTPRLAVDVVEAYWGNLGLDYLSRVVTVVVEVTNPGPGDSYAAVLTGAPAAPSTGVTLIAGQVPRPLGDLVAGESVQVALRYQLPLLGACQLIILGCTFPITVSATMPDALDQPGSASAPTTVRAPDLPPPLS